jgi:hypothetical protein
MRQPRHQRGDIGWCAHPGRTGRDIRRVRRARRVGAGRVLSLWVSPSWSALLEYTFDEAWKWAEHKSVDERQNRRWHANCAVLL